MNAPLPALRTIQILAGSCMLGLLVVSGILVVILRPWGAEGVIEPVIGGAVAFPLLLLAGLTMVAAPPFVGRLIGPEQATSAEEWAVRYQREVIVTFAIMEGSGIMLLLVAFLAGLPEWGVVGAGFALLLMAIRFPTTGRAGSRVGVR